VEGIKLDRDKIRYDLIDLQLIPFNSVLTNPSTEISYCADKFSEWFSTKQTAVNLPHIWINCAIIRAQFVNNLSSDDRNAANRYCSSIRDWSTFAELVSPTIGPMVFGEKKYGTYNWKNGLQVSRVYAAGIRHFVEHKKGSIWDDESELLHIDHLLANLMMASWIGLYNPEADNRYPGGT